MVSYINHVRCVFYYAARTIRETAAVDICFQCTSMNTAREKKKKLPARAVDFLYFIARERRSRRPG